MQRNGDEFQKSANSGFLCFLQIPEIERILPEKILKKNIFFFDLLPFLEIYSKKFTNFQTDINSKGKNLFKKKYGGIKQKRYATKFG